MAKRGKKEVYLDVAVTDFGCVAVDKKTASLYGKTIKERKALKRYISAVAEHAWRQGKELYEV
jgi:hypothetical protein